MNHEGLLEVSAKELNTGLKLETVIDANPDQFDAHDDPTGLNETELSPIEAERYKKPDYDLVYELESLDAYLEQLGESYRSHKMAKYMLDKIFDTKEWLYKNRRKLTAAECKSIRRAIDKYLKNLKSIKY
jgi:molecular chaperone DnaK (HSP70)